jgi:hypothetical protein
MATTPTIPAPGAPAPGIPLIPSAKPTVGTIPRTPSMSPEDMSAHLNAKVAAKNAAPAAPAANAPAPVPSPAAAPAPVPAPPSGQEPPAPAGDPSKPADSPAAILPASTPLAIEDIELSDEPVPVPQPVMPVQPQVATQPAAPVQPGVEDPAAIATRIAGKLGISTEQLTSIPEGRQLLASARLVQSLEAPADKGGLGYRPSVQEINEAFQAAAAIDALDYELDANPAGVILWSLTTQYDPQTGRYAPRPNAENFLDSIPQTLARLDPRLYQHAARPYLAAAIDELYSAYQTGRWANGAIAHQTPEDKAHLLDLARNFEQIFTGADRTKKTTLPPEVQAEKDRLAAAAREQEQQRQQVFSNRSTAFQDAVFSGMWNAVSADAKALISGSGNANSPHINVVEERAIEEAIDRAFGNSERGIAPANPILFQRYQHTLARYANAAKTARQNPNELILAARRMIQPHLRDVMRQYLSQQVEQTQAQATAANATAATAAARVEPQGAASPRAQSVVPPTASARQAGEDQAEYFTRLLNEKVALAGAQGKRV